MKAFLALALVILSSPAFAVEEVLDFNLAEETKTGIEAIHESYRKEGLKESLIKRLEISMYSLSTIKLTGGSAYADKAELEIGFYSDYVRDEGSGVNDLCTVKYELSKETRHFWKVMSASCEVYD